jgi:hypothetical protein
MNVRTGIVAGLAPGEGRGLGDMVARFTRMTGIDQMAKRYEELTGEPCGCEARQQALNRLFPFSLTT